MSCVAALYLQLPRAIIRLDPLVQLDLTVDTRYELALHQQKQASMDFNITRNLCILQMWQRLASRSDQNSGMRLIPQGKSKKREGDLPGRH
jgi:hypothetical protein